MHRLYRKIRLSTTGTRPHRNALNDKKVRPLPENSRHVLQMNLTAVAVGADILNRGFQEHHSKYRAFNIHLYTQFWHISGGQSNHIAQGSFRNGKAIAIG
jgi:hypothetical protein